MEGMASAAQTCSLSCLREKQTGFFYTNREPGVTNGGTGIEHMVRADPKRISINRLQSNFIFDHLRAAKLSDAGTVKPRQNT